MANADSIAIEVVYALPEQQILLTLQVPAGSTLQDAIRASGLSTRFPEINNAETRFGIFGKLEKTPAEGILLAGDRVEIYRPLLIDPKEARKARAEKAKAKRK